MPRVVTVGATLLVESGDYTDNNDNVREQQITPLVAGHPAFSQIYYYDGVNRLLAVTEDVNIWSRVYSYDASTGVGTGACRGHCSEVDCSHPTGYSASAGD